MLQTKQNQTTSRYPTLSPRDQTSATPAKYVLTRPCCCVSWSTQMHKLCLGILTYCLRIWLWHHTIIAVYFASWSWAYYRLLSASFWRNARWPWNQIGPILLIAIGTEILGRSTPDRGPPNYRAWPAGGPDTLTPVSPELPSESQIYSTKTFARVIFHSFVPKVYKPRGIHSAEVAGYWRVSLRNRRLSCAWTLQSSVLDSFLFRSIVHCKSLHDAVVSWRKNRPQLTMKAERRRILR